MSARIAPTNDVIVKPKILVLYYSMYGHVKTMADEFAKGVVDGGAEAVLMQVPETLSEEVLAKMHAPPKADVPVLTHDLVPSLVEYDGIAFGIPTRFGMMASQMKTFFDGTGGLWTTGGLVGKPATVFVSTATQGGGQETTVLTAVTQFAHHGMIFVPTGYSCPQVQFDLTEIHGGSPYGSGTYSGGDGSRQPSDKEKEFAVSHGKLFATTAIALKKGRAL